jgi:hypothetical protein
MKQERLEEIVITVFSLRAANDVPLNASMQSEMIAALIKHDGMIEAAKIQAQGARDTGDKIATGLEFVARMM